MMFKKNALWLIALLLALCLAFVGCDIADIGGNDNDDFEQGGEAEIENTNKPDTSPSNTGAQRPAEAALGVPKYSNKPYFELNGNQPKFTDEEIVSEAYEFYSELDSLGRCGYAMSCVGLETMPTEDREGSLSSVTPSGWMNKKYSSDIVEGGYIYNRAHLIGWQLTAETTNKKNLITGTRYMNVKGMLPFENMVADYIKETENHVMYRITPIYDKNDLVACGVIMEAYSVEDKGDGICFNVYIYNVQPQITIDYSTGNSWLSTFITEPSKESEKGNEENEGETTYILNTGTKKIHLPTCSSAINTKEENKKEYTGSIDDLLEQGYTACGICKPGN